MFLLATIKIKNYLEKVVKNHWFCTGDLGKHHRGKFYFVDNDN